MSLADFVPFLPEIFLAVAAFTVLLAGIPLGRRGKAEGGPQPPRLLEIDSRSCRYVA